VNPNVIVPAHTSPALRLYTLTMHRATFLIVVLLAACSLLSACNELKQWRNSQIQQSHKIAQGSSITPPAQPISVPDGVRKELPLDDSFTILSYSDSGDTVNLSALSAWDATTTAQWLVARLSELGYDSGDNPSRILEGVEYRRERGDFTALYIKLSLNTSDQCTVEYRASR